MARNRARLERAFRELLQALGHPSTGELSRTPARAAELWQNRLLAGESRDLAQALGKTSPSKSRGPVSVQDVGIHLVCPHHLTVAFGTAHVAYIPGGDVVGLGGLTRLVEACTSRLVLQEDATQEIVDALVEVIGARASVAVLEATHPCHNLTSPRAHAARVVSWAHAGESKAAKKLERELAIALRR